MTQKIPSAEWMREHFAYHESGNLIRLKRIGTRGKAGLLAKPIRHHTGYMYMKIFDVMVAYHRAVFAVVHGRWPNGDIDHINRVRHDNRIDNLRECTKSQNSHNTEMNKRNVSGFRGVTWDSLGKRWRITQMFEGKRWYFGYSDSAEEGYLILCFAREFYGLG